MNPTDGPAEARRGPALLVLADGEVFEGEAAGAAGEARIATGELVFNTALCGYQEVITDPSYAGQVIAFTYPHIGNYGTNAADDEARPAVLPGRGGARPDRRAEQLAVGARASRTSWSRHGVPAITGVDTRRLTRHLRRRGAMPCAFGTAPEGELAEAAAPRPRAPTAATWWPRSPRRTPTPAATGPAGWWPTTSG